MNLCFEVSFRFLPFFYLSLSPLQKIRQIFEFEHYTKILILEDLIETITVEGDLAQLTMKFLKHLHSFYFLFLPSHMPNYYIPNEDRLSVDMILLIQGRAKLSSNDLGIPSNGKFNFWEMRWSLHQLSALSLKGHSWREGWWQLIGSFVERSNHKYKKESNLS